MLPRRVCLRLLGCPFTDHGGVNLVFHFHCILQRPPPLIMSLWKLGAQDVTEEAQAIKDHISSKGRWSAHLIVQPVEYILGH